MGFELVNMRKQARIVFATYFAGCENVHLTKDVGMIPIYFIGSSVTIPTLSPTGTASIRN